MPGDGRELHHGAVVARGPDRQLAAAARAGSSRPGMSNVSRRSGRAIPRSARSRRRAAGRPCRPGCCGGCARSSRRCTACTPSSSVPLAAQSRRAAGAVFLAGQHHQRRARRPCTSRARRRSSSARRRAGARVTPPSVPGTSRLLEPDVGERAAHHHAVVAAARAVAVEVRLGSTPCSCRNLPAGLAGGDVARPARCGRS